MSTKGSRAALELQGQISSIHFCVLLYISADIPWNHSNSTWWESFQYISAVCQHESGDCIVVYSLHHHILRFTHYTRIYYSNEVVRHWLQLILSCNCLMCLTCVGLFWWCFAKMFLVTCVSKIRTYDVW